MGNTDWIITCQSVNKSIKVACVSKLSRKNFSNCQNQAEQCKTRKTRKTVSRRERKQLHLNYVVPERPQEEKTYTSSKRSISSIRSTNVSLSESKATLSPKEKYTRTKYDICDKNLDLPTALANRSKCSRARRTEYRMQVSNMITVNFMFCPSKSNSWRFKGIYCDRNEPYRGVKLYEATCR